MSHKSCNALGFSKVEQEPKTNANLHPAHLPL